ncbi:multidrug MFS transporter [Bacillus manliponensis]|uniref:Multidrug MFS transporter n=1 Tax=Bacillus manliponensis TaxID=574376 RepID=A0A073K8B3_9BACI|nr:MFS transporter [Bacillus manliponensis]KEK18468.1 multidrug MFS transporter [Bacillus manliponensis]
MPKKVWLLVAGMVINVTGASFLWPFNTIYLHEHLGKSLSVAGLVLMINSLTGIVGNMLGGILFDKWGGYKSTLVGIVITLVSILGLVFFHGWPLYVVWLALIGFGSGMVFPAMYAMVGTVWPEGGRRAFNAMYVGQNVGIAIGTACGGLVASYRFDYIFLANFILYFIFFLIAFIGFRGMDDKKEAVNETKEETKQGWSLTPGFRALLIVCVAYALCWVAYVQWQGAIATYIGEIGISLRQYSLLWTINGLMIVCAQPLVSMVIRWTKRSLKQQIMIGIGIFAVSFLILSQAQQFSMFVVAMIILTIGELFVWPAVPTIANILAPNGKVGFYQGVVNSGATVGKMFGPVVGGAVVDIYNMEVLFIAITVMLVVAILAASLYDKGVTVEEPKEEKIAV